MSRDTSFLFKGQVSDLDIPADQQAASQDPKTSLIWEQNKREAIIDSFESNVLGIAKAEPKKVVKTKNIVLAPEHEDDQELLNELMNNASKYNVVRWSETWTRTGEFKVFLVYQEFES